MPIGWAAGATPGRPAIDAASTLGSKAEAEAALSSVMEQKESEIAAWTATGAKGPKALDGPFSGGKVLARGASSTVVGSGARVVLRRAADETYFILTGSPIP
jgi:hypothetical protein